MNNEKSFNLKEFKEKVFDDLQRTRKTQARIVSAKQKDLPEYSNQFGFIKRNILKTLNKVMLYADNQFSNLQATDEKYKKIDEILNDSRVKLLLCDEYNKHKLDKLFAEKLDFELVTIFTKLFIDKPIAKELNIEKEVIFFSLLIQKTKEKGFEEFRK
ncbi:MAG: hypothetical protein MUC29_04905 [Pyrinomonadaceae bacterium]|jgi:hypothetical protein|nr:hypothetical protein [Pyrinomonadaceae bacterium]